MTMRKIVSGLFLSLDGVLQAPGALHEDPTGGFVHGGWATGYWDDAMSAEMGEVMGGEFDLLLGRRTYEIFAAHWPFVPADDPIGQKFNRITKYVVTSSAEPLEWVNSVALRGVDDVAALKRSDGPDLLIQGSSELYPDLLKAKLIDRFFVMIFPVLLGQGKKPFPVGIPASALKLTSQKLSSTGVIIAHYEPAGDVQYGSFALEPPTEAELARRARLKQEDKAYAG